MLEYTEKCIYLALNIAPRDEQPASLVRDTKGGG